MLVKMIEFSYWLTSSLDKSWDYGIAQSYAAVDCSTSQGESKDDPRQYDTQQKIKAEASSI